MDVPVASPGSRTRTSGTLRRWWTLSTDRGRSGSGVRWAARSRSTSPWSIPTASQRSWWRRRDSAVSRRSRGARAGGRPGTPPAGAPARRAGGRAGTGPGGGGGRGEEEAGWAVWHAPVEEAVAAGDLERAEDLRLEVWA